MCNYWLSWMLIICFLLFVISCGCHHDFWPVKYRITNLVNLHGDVTDLESKNALLPILYSMWMGMYTGYVLYIDNSLSNWYTNFVLLFTGYAVFCFFMPWFVVSVSFIFLSLICVFHHLDWIKLGLVFSIYL